MEAAEDEAVEVDIPSVETEKRLGAQRHRQRLGESIVGDRRETSPYEISFGDSVDWRLLCKKLLRPQDIAKLKDAIHNNYFFEMFVEDLPMWGYIGDISNEDMIIGETEGSSTYLFTHLHFILGYNKNQIVAAKVTTDVRFFQFFSFRLSFENDQHSTTSNLTFSSLSRTFFRWTAKWILPM